MIYEVTLEDLKDFEVTTVLYYRFEFCYKITRKQLDGINESFFTHLNFI